MSSTSKIAKYGPNVRFRKMLIRDELSHRNPLGPRWGIIYTVRQSMTQKMDICIARVLGIFGNVAENAILKA